jgi:lactoylglutathione lyase
MTMKLTYVIKYVGDMGQAIQFYKDQLGLTLRFQSPEWSEFETGDTTLALHLASHDHPAGTSQLGFGIPDIDSFYAEKKDNGVEFISAPSDLFGSRIAKFKDSEGAECSVSGK